MRRISITKEFTWDMAHMLAAHDGLCRNVHGHTYKMQVEVCRSKEDVIIEDESSRSMVIDFKDLKNIVKTKIVDKLDHGFVYWTLSPDPVEHEIAEILKKNGRKVMEVSYRPTAEEMAMSFFSEISDDIQVFGLELLSIRVWETPTSFAEFKKEN